MTYDLAAINEARVKGGKRALTPEEATAVLAERSAGRATEDGPEFLTVYLTNLVLPGDPGPKPGSYSAGSFKGKDTP